MGAGFLEPLVDRPVLAEAFARSPVPKVVTSLIPGEAGTLAEVNEAFCELLGYRRDQLIGHSWRRLVPDDDVGAVDTVLAGMVSGKAREAAIERVLLRSDGTPVWVRAQTVVVNDGSGRAYAVGEILASSGRKALAQSEARFRTMIDSSPIAMAVLGPDGDWLRANPAVSSLFGYTGPELAEVPLPVLVHPDERDDELRILRELVSGERDVFRGRRRYQHKDGRDLSCMLTVTALRGGPGIAVQILAQIVDVTETVAAEQAAARESDRLRTTIAVQHEIAAVADDRAAVLRSMAEHTLRVLPGGDSAWVQIFEPENRTMRVEAVIGRLAGREFPPVPLAGSLAGLAFESDTTLRCDDTATDPRISRALAAVTGTSSMVAAPVRAPGSGPFGTLLVGSERASAFSEADEHQLTLLADALGAALRHADDIADRDELLHRSAVALQFLKQERAAVITAERAARTAVDRELQRLRDTLAVQREVLAAAADRDATMRVVAERAVGLFPAADGAAVELSDGTSLIFAAAAGSLADCEGLRVPLDGSLSGHALRTDTVVHSEWDALRTDTVVHSERDAEDPGITSTLIAPLHAGHTGIGVLKISARRPGAFDEADEQQLALLADSLSSALRHADDAANASSLLAERTRALSELEVSENRFRLTFDNSPLGVTLSSLRPGEAGRYLQVNPAMTTITGYTTAELVTMSYADLQLPKDAASTWGFQQRLLAGEVDAVSAERRYRHKDGHPIWVSVRTAVVRGPDGAPRYVVNQVDDITARRAADAELRRDARMLELIPAAVIVRELDGRILWWNTGASALYGWPLGAVQGKVTHQLLGTVFPGGMDGGGHSRVLLREGCWDGQLEHLTADGRTLTVLSRQVLHQPDSDGDGDAAPQILEVNTDVTAARAAERALAENEQRFRGQFANSAVGQVIQGLDGSLLAVNAAYAAMVGRTVDELTALTNDDLLEPDDLIEHTRLTAGLFAGEADAYTHGSRLRHADGHWVDAEATVSLVRDDTGRPKHFIAVVSDVSKRRAAERARDDVAAALADRNTELEAANQLKLDIIGMLGHEIGNPLTAIRGHAEVLVDDWPQLTDERRGRAIDAIYRQAGRLDDIVQEVLAMVTIESGTIRADRQALSIRTEIGRALTAVDVDVAVHGDDHRVAVHPGHLQQILVNLLTNAAKYGGGATAIRITDETRRIRVVVEDHGPGVPEEFRVHLFDRLTRADRDARSVNGTGLGLYIVRGLAHANDGDIRYEPDPAGGSRFILDLQPV